MSISDPQPYLSVQNGAGERGRHLPTPTLHHRICLVNSPTTLISRENSPLYRLLYFFTLFSSLLNSLVKHSLTFDLLRSIYTGQVPGPKSYLKAFPNVYASACGTSFYDQCYPDGTVNFAFSAFAFHYLSKKPCDVTDGIHHTMITCPKEQETFREQAAKDWETILLNRATEMAPGE